VAGMLGLAAHPGVDANALPAALAVLESVLAADPELHAPQVLTDLIPARPDTGVRRPKCGRSTAHTSRGLG
jgi:hypothetical protein